LFLFDILITIFIKNKYGNGENVPPGTLADTVITTCDKFDYFLCSHFGLKGTSRPCHYVVLHDENEFDRDSNPLLAYVLTCIFARSTTSVSYPTPTYYADICAERGRLLISKQRFFIYIHYIFREINFITIFLI
jgi:eukaryotic translation initiation factor 2C